MSNIINNKYTENTPSVLVYKTGKSSQGWRDFDEDVEVLNFRDYIKRLSNKMLLMRNIVDSKKGMILKPCNSSRYFDGGCRKTKRNIKQRFGKYYNAPGTFFTATYDHKRFNKWEAWERVSKDIRKLLHGITMRYNRAGRRAPKYIWVLEEQKETGYPHVHIFYPGLKYLLDKKVLKGLWSFGRSRIEKADSVNVGNYVCKYVTKIAGWSDEALAFIKKHRMRMYGYSRCYTLPAETRKPNEWLLTYSSGNRMIISRVVQITRKLDEVINYDEYIGSSEHLKSN